MADIDALSRKTPCICKVAPTTQKVHIQDVNRAGGIFGILGELNRAGLLDASVKTVHSGTLGEAIEKYDIMSPSCPDEIRKMYRAAPGGKFSTRAWTQSEYYGSTTLTGRTAQSARWKTLSAKTAGWRCSRAT